MFHFDHANRLVEARRKSDNALIASYLYTADGKRVLKTLGTGAVTRYLRMGWQIIEERDASDAVLRQYVKGRGMDEAIQMKDHTQAGQPVFYYHSNSQGFPGALTDALGAVTEYYEYSMLGRRTILDSNKTAVLAASKVGNHIGFHGKWHDEETGLQYFEFRYYSPITGQFISTDPLGWDGGVHGNIREAFGGDGWNNEDPMGLGPLVEKVERRIAKNRARILKLESKIANIELDIKKRQSEFRENILDLPGHTPNEKACPSESRAGHAAIITTLKATLARRKAALLFERELAGKLLLELGAAKKIELEMEKQLERKVEREFEEKSLRETEEKLANKGLGVVEKRLEESLLKRVGGFFVRKVPVVLILTFSYDTHEGGVGHATNSALWPVSELWNGE